MKVLQKELIRKADEFTIEHEPISSVNLMERASHRFTDAFIKYFPAPCQVSVICGKGNNGGDGLAVSRLLLDRGYKVLTFIVHYSDQSSPDFSKNLQRLKKTKNHHITELTNGSGFFPEGVIIDALWGTGLSRPVEGFARDILKQINHFPGNVIALDIPSGLFSDAKNDDDAIVNADLTITFQSPKYSFLIRGNGKFTGKIEVADIGLSKKFIAEADTKNYYTTAEDLSGLQRRRSKDDHKGTFGHSLIFGGSHGKVGAPLLAGMACLKSGSGLVTAYIPACGYEIYQGALPEAMVITDAENKIITGIPDTKSFDAIGIGPGMGKAEPTKKAFGDLLSGFSGPIVIDADGLNLLSENRDFLNLLRKDTILTPHPREFSRLAEKKMDGYEEIETARRFSMEHNVIIVLKGAHTAVVSPDGNVYFNSTGNPGMATGGTGDVLTGVITAFLSQKYSPLEAARIGVFLHGLAGDLAADKTGYESLTARDVINNLPAAIKQVFRSPAIQ